MGGPTAMSTWEVLLVYDTHNLLAFVYGSGGEEAGGGVPSLP